MHEIQPLKSVEVKPDAPFNPSSLNLKAGLERETLLDNLLGGMEKEVAFQKSQGNDAKAAQLKESLNKFAKRPTSETDPADNLLRRLKMFKDSQ